MPFAKIVDSKIKLSDFDPDDHGGLSEEEALTKREKLGKEFGNLQDLLYAAGMHKVLVVLQGIDTSGKDGSIRNVLRYGNAQSVRVASFKVPTDIELGHDFLWRVHSQVPGSGGMTIFNRSHYEDVLVARVHELVKKDVWEARYDHINAFEKLLADSGTVILKFFLHISKDEQGRRLLDREADPEKAFKLSVGDWKERDLWKEYHEAYEDVLNKCSTNYAPWRIVPANHKWFRDVAILQALVHELEPFKKDWKESLKELGEREKAALLAFRKSK